MRNEIAPRPSEELRWHTPGESTPAPELSTDANVETSLDATENESRETTPDAVNPSDANVESAKSRIEKYRNEGARLGEIGKAISQAAIESGKIGLGATSYGIQNMVSRGKAAYAHIKNRAQQYKRYRDHGAALKENTAREKAARDAQDEAYASYEDNIATTRENEWNTEAITEVNRLRGVEAGDADSFNATEEDLTANQSNAREAAKNYVVGQAHEEALALNKQYDTAYENQKAWINAADERKDPKWMATPINFNDVQRSAVDRANREMLDSRYEEALAEDERRENARIEQENEAYDATYDKAEDFLKQFKNRKDIGFTEARQALRAEFSKEYGEGKDYIVDALEDAFDGFAGKKLKQAARAARIAKGRAQIKAMRVKAVEASGNAIRSTETYQKARSLTFKIGKTISRFAKRTAKAAGAARDAWHESKPVSPATESEPSTNE